MDEYIDKLSPNGDKTGEIVLKSDAHKFGWHHATVHIWFYTADKKILLQKRAETKKVFPGLWDISVAGHIAANETIIEAAKRETLEEIGLKLNVTAFTKIGTRQHHVSHKNGIIDNEFHHIYIAELELPLSNLKIQEEEVDAIQLFELDILKKHKKP
jgi:Isopentenyldiphosphate isomerase